MTHLRDLGCCCRLLGSDGSHCSLRGSGGHLSLRGTGGHLSLRGRGRIISTTRGNALRVVLWQRSKSHYP